MKWPQLVPDRLCKTPIQLDLAGDGVDKYGDPIPPIHYEGLCNYQDEAHYILDDRKQKIEITGKALFNGDICPDLPVISGGTAVICGETRHISKGRKARNPDGTVNYTEVMLQ